MDNRRRKEEIIFRQSNLRYDGLRIAVKAVDFRRPEGRSLEIAGRKNPIPGLFLESGGRCHRLVSDFPAVGVLPVNAALHFPEKSGVKLIR